MIVHIPTSSTYRRKGYSRFVSGLCTGGILLRMSLRGSSMVCPPGSVARIWWAPPGRPCARIMMSIAQIARITPEHTIILTTVTFLRESYIVMSCTHDWVAVIMCKRDPLTASGIASPPPEVPRNLEKYSLKFIPVASSKV